MDESSLICRVCGTLRDFVDYIERPSVICDDCAERSRDVIAEEILHPYWFEEFLDKLERWDFYRHHSKFVD